MASATKRPQAIVRDAHSRLARAQLRRAVVERLCSLARPTIAAGIVEDALRIAGVAEMPDVGAGFSQFVRVHLSHAASRKLGEDAADALLNDLEPLLLVDGGSPDAEDTFVRSGVRDVHPTMMATVRPLDENLFVLFASVDPRREQRLRAALGPESQLIVVEDVMELVDAAQGRANDRPFIVIDGTAPSVELTTLSAIAPELSKENVRVILWGTDRAQEADLRAVLPSAREWLRFDAEVGPKDLAIALRAHTR